MKSSPVEVQKYLASLNYPVSKDEIISVAQEHGASEEVMADLEAIDDAEYTGPTEITEQFNSERIVM